MTTSTIEAPPAEGTIELISPNAKYRLQLESNVDDYSNLGGHRVVQKGRYIQFVRGRATVPASLRPELEQHRAYRRYFFFADDPGAGLPGGGLPLIISGQARARLASPEQPPLPDWDALGPREIREAIDAGRVADPREALAWETRADGGRARGQVLAALGRAINPDGDDEEEAPPAPPAPTPPAPPVDPATPPADPPADPFAGRFASGGEEPYDVDSRMTAKGGGYFVLSNGEGVRGRDQAVARQRELDGQPELPPAA